MVVGRTLDDVYLNIKIVYDKFNMDYIAYVENEWILGNVFYFIYVVVITKTNFRWKWILGNFLFHMRSSYYKNNFPRFHLSFFIIKASYIEIRSSYYLIPKILFQYD